MGSKGSSRAVHSLFSPTHACSLGFAGDRAFRLWPAQDRSARSPDPLRYPCTEMRGPKVGALGLARRRLRRREDLAKLVGRLMTRVAAKTQA